MKSNGSADDPIGRIIDLQLGGQWERINQRVQRSSRKTKLSDIFPRQGQPNDKDLLDGEPPKDNPTAVFHESISESGLGSIAGEGEFVPIRCLWNPQQPSNLKIYDWEHHNQDFLKSLVPEVSKLHYLMPTEFEKYIELNEGADGSSLSWGSPKEKIKLRGRTQIRKHDWLENLLIGAIDRKYHPTLDKKKPTEIKTREIQPEIKITTQEKQLVTLLQHGLNRGEISKLIGKSRHSLDQSIYRMRKKGLKV